MLTCGYKSCYDLLVEQFDKMHYYVADFMKKMI